MKQRAELAEVWFDKHRPDAPWIVFLPATREQFHAQTFSAQRCESKLIGEHGRIVAHEISWKE